MRGYETFVPWTPRGPPRECWTTPTWDWFVETLRHHPEMALFLTLAIGYAIGRIRLGGVTLGAVVGVLITGVIIGQLGIKVSADLKTGAATSAPSLAAMQEVAKSKIPTLGYGVSYAVGNGLLALWGSIMVALTYRG